MICNLLLATSQSNKYPSTMGILRSPSPLSGISPIDTAAKMGICSSKEGTAAAPSATPSARNGVSVPRVSFSINSRQSVWGHPPRPRQKANSADPLITVAQVSALTPLSSFPLLNHHVSDHRRLSPALGPAVPSKRPPDPGTESTFRKCTRSERA